PLAAAYRAVVASERERLAPQVAETEKVLSDLNHLFYDHDRFLRHHPEVPKRLNWLQREMHGLDVKLTRTRSELDRAIGQDWKTDDPSWAPTSRTPVDPELAAAQRWAYDHNLTPNPELSPTGPELVAEHDFGPDLGL
ncbi:MAG: hypothetical protein M3Y04_08980, partial [Actinomycetota bacterium]|nr:hypothetical protein [Actinomycetota bacterium]